MGVLTGIGKVTKRGGRAARGKKAAPKPKLSDLGYPYETELPKNNPKPPLKALSPVGGGKKGGPPGPQRGNSVTVPESRVPMKSAGRSVTPSPTRGGTNEKFMGNLPYEKITPARNVPKQVTGSTGGGGGGSSIPGGRTPAGGRGRGRAAAAGAVAGVAAVVTSDSGKAPQSRQTSNSASTPPNKGADPNQASAGARGSSSSTTPVPAQGGGAQKPAGGSRGSQRASSGATSRPSRAMHGKELADYLGLSGDSAVRTYMETGKHKYQPKYPTATGQKAGTVTKAAKRTQKTR